MGCVSHVQIPCENFDIHISNKPVRSVSSANPRLTLEQEMQTPPNTTAGRIALVAQGEGAQDPDRTSQLLKDIFNAPDYLDTLCSYPEPQQYIDGLYEVYYYYPYFVKKISPSPVRYFVVWPSRSRCADVVSGLSGRQGEKLVFFRLVTKLRLNSRNKIQCQMLRADIQTSGKQSPHPVLPLHSRSFA